MQFYLHAGDPECMYLVMNLAARMNHGYSEGRMRNLVNNQAVINSHTATSPPRMGGG